MKTFPIKGNEYNTRFGSFHQKAMLPKFPWGQKFYMEYEGALRAVRPLYVAHISNAKPTGSPSQDGPKDVVCFDIAGIGERLIKWEVYYSSDQRRVVASRWNNRIFATTEDYDRFVKGESGTEYVPDCVSIEDILWDNGYRKLEECDVWCKRIVMWCWNYEEPRECPVCFKDLWIDADGSHVTVIHEGWGKPEYPTYHTREDCLAANRKGVVEFEEPKEEKVEIMDTTNGHNAEYVKTINQIWADQHHWWEFCLIVAALMHRDGSQILEETGVEIATYSDDEKMVYEVGPVYLQRISDDQDLKQIIDFIGF